MKIEDLSFSQISYLGILGLVLTTQIISPNIRTLNKVKPKIKLNKNYNIFYKNLNFDDFNKDKIDIYKEQIIKIQKKIIETKKEEENRIKSFEYLIKEANLIKNENLENKLNLSLNLKKKRRINQIIVTKVDSKIITKYNKNNICYKILQNPKNYQLKKLADLHFGNGDDRIGKYEANRFCKSFDSFKSFKTKNNKYYIFNLDKNNNIYLDGKKLNKNIRKIKHKRTKNRILLKTPTEIYGLGIKKSSTENISKNAINLEGELFDPFNLGLN